LPLVDNTADSAKPVSTPQQNALDLKIDKTSIVDDLTSTDATKVLSAKQGKSLYDLIQANNVTLVVYEFLATAGQTVFSGVDANGLTLLYTAGTGTIVLRNGVQLEKTVDYTATDGSSVTFVTANDLNDLIQVMAFGTFSVANHYTKAEDDALLLTKADKSTTYTKTEDDARFVQKTDVIDTAHGGTGATSMGAGAVGIVSQAAGVPTGAILQSSWGAGGGYIKYADGTMIQVIKRVVTRDINQAYGSMFITPVIEAAQAWPIPFVSLVFESATVIGESLSCWWAGAGYGTVTQTQAGFLYSAVTRASSSYTITYRAEGRWF
jgi:hypothetical protein